MGNMSKFYRFDFVFFKGRVSFVDRTKLTFEMFLQFSKK